MASWLPSDAFRITRGVGDLGSSGSVNNHQDNTASFLAEKPTWKDLGKKATLFFTGLAGLGTAALTLISVFALTTATLAAAVTPLGWAVAGCAAIALLIMLCRHFVMKAQGEDPETGKLLKSVLYTTFLTVGMIVPIVPIFVMVVAETRNNEK